MIGNDDGVKNIGIDALARSAGILGSIQIVAPERQQSARAKSMTFHKPIRFSETHTKSGIPAYAYNSTPADSIIIYKHLFGLPDLVLSGINSGDNTTIHSILTSGTVAVALEAGLLGIPSFAISMDVPEEYFFKDSFPGEITKASDIAIRIVQKILSNMSKAFWDKCLFVNLNFPSLIDQDTKLEVVGLETWKYDNYLVERVDPKGEKYYWLWGNKRENYDIEKDSYKLFVEKNITLTPVSLGDSTELFNEAKKILEHFTP